MNRTAARIICAIAILAAVACHAADLESTRVYEATRVEQPPVIDGRLDDPCWQGAPKADSFVRIMKGPAEIQQTLFQVAWDDANLYIAVTCLEPNPEAIKAEMRANDVSAVMGDDAVEIFLHPRLDEPTYYQLAANSLGTRYDGRAFDSSWNADWQAAATVGADAWYLECAVSFASLGVYAAPGAMWGLNVNRDRLAGGDTEWSGWSDTMDGFHVPERFGRLVFTGTVTGVNRSLIMECARYARRSIELEQRIAAALPRARGSGIDLLDDEDRAQAQPAVERAVAALDGLHAFMEADRPLDLAGWARVTAELEAAAEEMDEVSWLIRFAELLAQD